MCEEKIRMHEQTEVIAQSGLGTVKRCSCGAITVTLQYLSIRFDPEAFQDLQMLLTRAQRILDTSFMQDREPTQASINTSSVH